jgi:superoxide reductase
MSEKMAVYKCSVCGSIVEGMNDADGELVCCGQPMQLMKENTTDAATEKHVPVVEKVDGGLKVTVGSVPHPMTEEHWIQWIEVVSGNKLYRQFLTPSDKPEAFFPGLTEGTAREFCNLHGFWKA